MSLKYNIWDEDTAKQELKSRLDRAKKYRYNFEARWLANEAILYQEQRERIATTNDVDLVELSASSDMEYDSPNSNISINYAFKYLRFLHAQMSANPPSVVPKPVSQDYEDRQASKAADDLIHYSRKEYELQEKQDLTTLETLTYGTGILRPKWDVYKGELISVNKEEGTVTMTGDIDVSPVRIWDFWLDPTAATQDKIRFVFQRFEVSIAEACILFPDKKELLEQYATEFEAAERRDTTISSNYKGYGNGGTDSERRVIYYEYIEKAAPVNLMQGRRIFHLEDGTALTSPAKPNNHPQGKIPHKILTDIDVPGQVYGKTFVDYIVRLQDVLDSMDSAMLEMVQTHSVPRLVVVDDGDVSTEEIETSASHILRIRATSANTPHFIQPPSSMPAMVSLREQLLMGMAEIASVNESMEGKIGRELASAAMQTAINAGNQTRRRLFNKYQLFIRDLYVDILLLMQKYFTDKRKVCITGEDGAMTTAYYSSSDIQGGYTFDLDYGVSWSLDPAARQDQIIQLAPMLKEAGVSPKAILSYLRLSEVSGIVDRVDMAARRQREIIEEMISAYAVEGNLVYIAPEKNEPHEDMLEACKDFRITTTFKFLPQEVKALIDRHIDDRLAAIAEAAGGGGGGAAAPAMPEVQQQLPMGGGLPPILPGM